MSGIIPQNFGIYTEDIKSEVYTETSDGVVGYESEGNVQTFDRTEQRISEVYDVKCIDNIHSKSKSQAENFGGIKHLKPELSGESCDDMADEKPCIAALRASVAAYSVNHGRKGMELESFPNTEMSLQEMLEPHCGTASNAPDEKPCIAALRASVAAYSVNHGRKGMEPEKFRNTETFSQEMLEPHCGTASNAQEADQESVDNRQTDARTSEWNQLEIKKRVEHSDKGKSLGCPETLNELSQGAELKKTTPNEVSQSQQEILHRETSTDGPFQCFWCPWVYFQCVDRERHMKRSHREEYGKLLQEKYSQHMKGLHQKNGLHPCRTSSSPRSGKSLQIGQHKSSESCRNTESERTFIETETPVDMDKLEQNEQARRKVASNYISKQVCKRFCSMQKSKDHKIHTGKTPYKYDVCGKGFRDSSSVTVHNITYTGELPYKCDMCGKGFRYSSNLSVHKRTHTSETPYKCDVCGKRFGQKGNLSVHKRTHTGETPYKCDVCGKRFRQKSNLSVHKRTHTGERPYTYDVCGKGFRQSSSVAVHNITYTGEIPYKCDMCGKGFRYSSNLSVHKRTHTSETPYKCDVCGKRFGQKGNLSVHKRTHTDETPYKCDVCGKGFGQKGNLSVHKRTHTGEMPYKCGVCGKGFGQKGHLSLHKRTHTGETPYKCDVCGKMFGQKAHLFEHKRTHTGETPYKCDVCGKSFGRKGNLSVHKKTHTGETPYKCDVCGKGFRTSSGLCLHKRTHTGERPYNCDVCGKGFRDSSRLSVHKRTHTGETPYKCDMCGKGFVRKDHLPLHMRSHTGETPYKCDVCGKRFGQKGRLSVHKRIHTGETPYKCDVCGKGFRDSSNFSVHKRTHTGEVPYKKI